MATTRTVSANGCDGEKDEGIMSKAAGRFILQAKPKVRAGLRLLPAAMLLMGVATMTPTAGATSCAPSNIAVNGGNVSNDTRVQLDANGGTAGSLAGAGN